jgi:hypothetical protein
VEVPPQASRPSLADKPIGPFTAEEVRQKKRSLDTATCDVKGPIGLLAEDGSAAFESKSPKKSTPEFWVTFPETAVRLSYDTN